jgi:hypothetical protein
LFALFVKSCIDYKWKSYKKILKSYYKLE